MGTRALVCGRTDNGPEVIYIGFDGDPDYVGLILTENYATPEAVEELLELGNMRSLGETPKLCRGVGIPEARLLDLIDDGYIGDSLIQAVNAGRMIQIEWAYAFEDGVWECMPGPFGATKWDGMPIEQGAEMVRQERDDAEAENMMGMESNEQDRDDLPSLAPQ